MQLQKYEKDQIELYINVDTGESFASISGYARMVGKTRQAISARIEGGNSIELKTFEVPTAGGIQGVKLLNEKLIVEWLFKDDLDLAKKMTQAGVRAFLHHQAGFQTKSVLPGVSQLPFLEHYPRLKHLALNRQTSEDIADPCTINEYLEYFQIALTPGQFRALAQRVATTYRTLTMLDPQEKRCGVNNSRSWCYEKEYQFLIANALEVLLSGGVKRGYEIGRNLRSSNIEE